MHVILDCFSTNFKFKKVNFIIFIKKIEISVKLCLNETQSENIIFGSFKVVISSLSVIIANELYTLSLAIIRRPI